MQILDASKTLRIFTAEQYVKLDIPERTELLEGLIYDVSPRNESHRYAVRKLTQYLSRKLQAGQILQIQDSVAVPGWQGADAPEIDVAILREESFGLGPTAAAALALIEVSDTTYRGKKGDRLYKIPLYVRTGIPSWIVNIPLRQVEFYGSAADLELEHGRVFAERDTLDILGITVRVADLFEISPEDSPK